MGGSVEALIEFLEIAIALCNTLGILYTHLPNVIGEYIEIIKDYADLPQVSCHAKQINQVIMNSCR